MKDYTVENIRNIGLFGHGSTGKTSLCEALLYVGGAIGRMGVVDEGSTTTDYSEEEIERRLTISLGLGHIEWKNCKVNIVDTPGYTDFAGDVAGALRVVDLMICLLNGPSGIEVGTEHTLRQLDQTDLPRMFFVNKMDKEHAALSKSLDALVELYGVKVVAVNWPIGEAAEFKGLVDLVKMKGYAVDASGKQTDLPIPEDVLSAATAARERLVEAAAEADDTLLEKFFESGELNEDELQQGLRRGVKEGKIFPVLCGVATTAAGARMLLDFIEHYGPNPADRPAEKGLLPDTDNQITREHKPTAPFSGFIFKTVSEPHVGELSLIKVVSGAVKPGEEVLNATRSESERMGQIYLLNGKQRTEIGRLIAGDMGAVVKLKATHTGDTLSDPKAPIVLAPIAFPDPILDMAVKPISKGDEERMGTGLTRLHEEDPTFFHRVLPDIRQTILYGQGELHFEVVTSKLRKRYNVDVTLEKPRIPYRETIKGKTEVEYKYKKQSGGRGQFGHVFLRLEPLARGGGFDFANEITGGVIPAKFIPSVEKGIVDSMHEGGLSGHPVVDIRVALYYGSYHTVDSSDMAFKVAGSMGFKEGFLKCRPVMLEPIYELAIKVPDDFTGDVMGDLSSRRGKILGMDPDGKWQVIRANAPLAELYKYSTTLRSLTQGRGTYTRNFSHYDEVPTDIAAKVVEEAKSAKKAAEE